jgi:apolipoprotein D and lipocalin family protein
MKKLTKLLLLCFVLSSTSCATIQNNELKTIEYLDIEKFMGDWFVISVIPTFLEKDIFNAIESYTLNSDGTISTEFSFNKGGFDGDRKKYNPKGFIMDKDSNALWGMQFIWPIKADFRVVYLSDDYSYTIIGRNKRDYVWLMSRSPMMSDEDYSNAMIFIESIGYDMTKIVKIPQKWSE